ncbi:MAG TPA: glycosyltransferase family 4 protein [Ignavibacteria bacterium]|nr:glycosyltransferase family 4 protein [Ignavibacteria bacterium]
MLKFNFIIPGIFNSGGMRMIFEYCENLANLGHDVAIYYPTIPYDLNKGVYNFNRLKILRNQWYLALNDSRNLKNYQSNKYEIIKVLNINNYSVRDADFVIATSWPTAYSVDKLTLKKGKKLYFIQDYEYWWSNIKLVNESYKLNLRKFTTSKFLQSFLLEKFNINTIVINYGINFNKFYNNEPKVINKNKVISFIASTAERKNLNYALNVIDIIKKNYNNSTFISFNPIKINNLPEFIEQIINPTDEQIRNIYANSDMFIYTSSHEGYGLPPAEAMACKSLAISTNVGAIPEYIINNENGFICNKNNFHNMAETIIKHYDSNEYLLKLSLNGYEHIRAYFNWNKTINDFLNFITYD